MWGFMMTVGEMPAWVSSSKIEFTMSLEFCSENSLVWWWVLCRVVGCGAWGKKSDIYIQNETKNNIKGKRIMSDQDKQTGDQPTKKVASEETTKTMERKKRKICTESTAVIQASIVSDYWFAFPCKKWNMCVQDCKTFTVSQPVECHGISISDENLILIGAGSYIHEHFIPGPFVLASFHNFQFSNILKSHFIGVWLLQSH